MDRNSQLTENTGDPDRIRTCDPQIRNLMLYPAELRGRNQRRFGTGFWLIAQEVKNPAPLRAIGAHEQANGAGGLFFNLLIRKRTYQAEQLPLLTGMDAEGDKGFTGDGGIILPEFAT